MGPRKSASEGSNEFSYLALLQKLCKEEDVLIIPQFVVHYASGQVERASPRKSKDSKLGDRFGSNSVFTNDSKGDDLLICGSLQPPQVRVVYENPEDKDKPVCIMCKGIFIEFSLMNAIVKSFGSYSSVSCLRLENCCLTVQIVEALASLLSEEHAAQITELSLNGNEDIADVLPTLIKSPTSVRYLSLQRCSLEDADLKNFTECLGFSDVNDQKLQVLNLSMNKIGDLGVSYLAKALRTNRVLVSLSLAGNQIGDKGVGYLTEVLQKFQLKYEEVVVRRRRIFEMFYKKKNLVEKYVEEWKTKGEVEGRPSKTKSGERTGRKIRGPDGKIRCLSSRDKKTKLGTTKVNSGEKFQGKTRNTQTDDAGGAEPTPSEILALVQQVENEILPDKHPFVNEVLLTEDGAWCTGCWSLGNINLAYNYLSEKSLELFSEALYSQGEDFSPKTGLLRLVVLPGNLFHENLDEFQQLQTALIHRSPKKNSNENADLAPGSSITTVKRLSSSGKWNKNR